MPSELEPSGPARGADLLAMDEALSRLETADPDLAQPVEWRFFDGLSIEEIAGLLNVSDRTVKRRWRTARAFLFQDLAAQGIST